VRGCRCTSAKPAESHGRDTLDLAANDGQGEDHMAVKAAAAEPKPEFIVLDSNVFIADYWLRSSSFVLLREYLKKTRATGEPRANLRATSKEDGHGSTATNGVSGAGGGVSGASGELASGSQWAGGTRDRI
jgi:hypothetical protein